MLEREQWHRPEQSQANSKPEQSWHRLQLNESEFLHRLTSLDASYE
jgi:hypothetical protein